MRSSKRCCLGPQLVPSLLVKDLDATVAFYKRLGLTLTGFFPTEGARTWSEVTRDGVALQFYTDPPHGTPTEPVCSGTLYAPTHDVLALAEEPRDVGPFVWGPEVMEYGWRKFAVQDPNGYYLACTEPVEDGDEI